MRGFCQKFFICFFIGVGALNARVNSLGVDDFRYSSVEDQISPFLNKLNESPVDFSFIREGLLSVSSIDFGSDQTIYDRNFNRIRFDGELEDSEGHLRAPNNLEFGTIAHESFHAYFNNVLDEASVEWVRYRSKQVYPRLSSRKAFDALQELYGQFVEALVRETLDIHSALGSKTPRECGTRLMPARTNWTNLWNGDVFGYYRRNPLIEFAETAVVGPKVLVTEGWSSFTNFLSRDLAQYENTINLPQIDRTWISVNLFGNKLQKSFDRTFSQQISAAICAGACDARVLVATAKSCPVRHLASR